MSKFKAIFFDLDKTLVDSGICHKQANQKALSCYGLDYQAIRKGILGHKQFDGMRIIDIVKELPDASGKSEADLPLNSLYQARQEFFLNCIKQKSTLIPGANSALKASQKRFKVVALVSSGSSDYVNLILSKFRIGDYFTFSINGDKVIHGKPDPECYLKAFEKSRELVSDLSKQQCLAVEDAPIGVQAAQEAGLPVLFIPSRDEYQGTKANYQISTLKDFEKFIN